MRQVLMDSQHAFVARVPRPTLQAGAVLVQINYSMISIGTEIAGLKSSELPKIEQNTNSGAVLRSKIKHSVVFSTTALRYLRKAICNPVLAKQRLKMLAKQKLQKIRPEVTQDSAGNVINLHNETIDIGWNAGYSAMGEVIAVGAGVSDLSIGDKVVCAGAGKANHADVVCVPRNLVCAVPTSCDPIAAASTTIGTIALQGVRRAEPHLGDKVAVIGLGLLGQISTQLLKCNGCQVIGMDLQSERIQLACELGMQHGSISEADFKHQIDRLTCARGADITIICAATKSDAVINLAMEVTRRKGKVVIVGDVGLAVQRGQFYRKEIDLLMSTSYGPGRYDSNYEEQGHDYPYAYVPWTLNRNMQAYLDLITNKQVKIVPLIDRVVSIDQATETYDDLAKQSSPPLAVVFSYEHENTNTQQQEAITIKGHRKAIDAPINYVLVGVGAFGTSMLVPLFNQHNKFIFHKGVVSRDSVRGGNYARQNELEILASDIDAVLGNSDVQMVVIATKHNEHSEQVIAALQAGKHVFVEKPLATTWQQLDAVQACIDTLEQSPLLMVGFNRRFSPAMWEIKKSLDSRKTPLMMQYRLNGGYIPLEHWIQTQEGAGRNIGEACHIYDCFRYLAGSPVCEISATAINPAQLPYARNDNFVATLRYEDGSIATLTYTASGPKQGLAKERFEVFCGGEAFILDDYKQLTRASDQQVLWSGSVDKGHKTEIAMFADSLKESKPAPIAIDEILETTAVSLHIEDLLHGRN